MRFMVVERVRSRDAKAVCRHVRDKGRGLPEGLRQVGRRIEADSDRCHQVMDCDDARLLQEWVPFRGDRVAFEVVPSAETRAVVEPHLHGANP